ncbi:hypothetical protein AX774_g2947 [Zancudomyces culisetae]|uniref:Uncharacterized protein n=1 Tax=Zancudomyces culisetae TaxID=1213189 RepID=A0A1R1PRD9_ZANCU|nr:hypothetical protein AX774_g2947 [Zancudomyces culisetae]|eukprot:OMH83546.1 hypothetical protein AX774_g2947 [Zancudomyces culisetae]
MSVDTQTLLFEFECSHTIPNIAPDATLVGHRTRSHSCSRWCLTVNVLSRSSKYLLPDTDPNRCLNELSAAFESACAVAHASFIAANTPGGRLPSIRSHTTLLLKYSIGVHLICSRTYSSCSAFNFIHNCSKLLRSNISNPYISNTPIFVSAPPTCFNASLVRATIQSNIRVYIAIANPSRAAIACVSFNGTLYTDPRLPPRVVSIIRDTNTPTNTSALVSNKYARKFTTSMLLTYDSPFSFSLNSTFPNHRIAASNRCTFCCSSLLISIISILFSASLYSRASSMLFTSIHPAALVYR